MNAPTARPATSCPWLLALLLALLAVGVAVPRLALAQDKPADKDDDKEMADKDEDGKSDTNGKSDKADAGAKDGDGDDADKPKDKTGGKNGNSSKNAKEPQAKIYLLKTQKKAKLNGAEVMSVVLQDVFSGKTQTMFVPNSDPKGREYDPLPDVAAAVESIEEGAAVQVEAAKERGKWMISSLSRADSKPGEELPNTYVYVETDEIEDRGGNKTVIVTLTKFGREIKVKVPMWKNNQYRDANWEPEPKIDYELRRLQAGEVVDAIIKPGRPPELVEINRFYPPERGKFVGLKETTFNGAAAAAFEMLATDGTTVTITIPGVEQAHGGQKVLMPDPTMLRAVKRLKPDTEIIVIYREDGQTMFLRDLRFPKAGDKAASSGGDKNKMKPEGKDKDEEKDKDKNASGSGGAKRDDGKDGKDEKAKDKKKG